MIKNNKFFLFIYTFLILCILFNLIFKNNDTCNTCNTCDTFTNINNNKYTTYHLINDDLIKYELFTFSQLNFDLQKKILDKIINLYKNLIDIDVTKGLIEYQNKYTPVNDIIFAVRLNRIKDNNIIYENQHLLFDENKNINYSFNNNKIIKSSKLKLLLCNNILTASAQYDSFNIKMNNNFKEVIINNNQIASKNINLIQIDNLPIYLINLTDNESKIKIYKENIKI